MDIELTKEADAMICIIYKEYLSRRKSGQLLSKSVYIGHDTFIQQTLTPSLSLDDVTELCWSLERKGLLSSTPGDSRANNVRITDEGLIYMENRFKNKLDDVLSYISKLKAFLPIPFI